MAMRVRAPGVVNVTARVETPEIRETRVRRWTGMYGLVPRLDKGRLSCLSKGMTATDVDH